MDKEPQAPAMSGAGEGRDGALAAYLEHPWLSHYSPAVPAHIDVPDQPLSWLLDEAARQYGTNVAIEYYGMHCTYLRLASLADRFAHVLLQLGVKRGDRVSICLPNVPQFPIAFYGALKAGAVVVPTNPLYAPPEMEHQLKDSGARVLIMLDQFYPAFAPIQGRTPVEHVILTNVADYFAPVTALGYKLLVEPREQRGKPKVDLKLFRAQPGNHVFKEILGSASGRQGFSVYPLPEAPAPSDIAVLQYTGGTTGVAKGTMLSHRNLMANTVQAWTWNELPAGSHHVSLCVVPFFHVYGLTVAMNLSVYSGSKMVMLPRFVVKDTLKAIKKYRPDLFPGVPTMYLALAREVEKTKQDLSSIQICISGSAPLPKEVQTRFEAVSGARVVEGYGLTEASPVTHCNPVFGERRIGTIGLPLPNTESAIIDTETGAFLPPGQQGELVVRGPQVMQGYWNRPDETAHVMHEGWLRTGDIGVMSEDGYFTIVDRVKDIIIASGYKVFPRDIEEVLFQHPAVQETSVIGVPDPYRGETVRAYIVLKPGQQTTAEELTAYCKERLAIYKVPKQFVFRQELPKSLIGKVIRRELREQAIAETKAAGSGQRVP
ncbi:MAG TPA: long-chain fatty acid--CoA ligase [Ktedonobacterales bacterium]|nr:long-chain fatty acid--CoA ligase [Ktedonobacterales bacterium]